MNLELELLNHIRFIDSIYTNDEERRGWITKIEFDIKKDQMKIIATLAPVGYIGLIIERGIDKNDPFPRIKESGEQDTVIIER